MSKENAALVKWTTCHAVSLENLLTHANHKKRKSQFHSNKRRKLRQCSQKRNRHSFVMSTARAPLTAHQFVIFAQNKRNSLESDLEYASGILIQAQYYSHVFDYEKFYFRFVFWPLLLIMHILLLFILCYLQPWQRDTSAHHLRTKLQHTFWHMRNGSY